MQNKKDFGQFIGICAVAAIAILFAMAVAGPGTRLSNAWQELSGDSSNTINTTNQQALPATGMSVVGGPSLSAARIDQILSNAGSPAAGSGQDLYNLGVQYNIDPAFALAVFHHESNYGRAGMAASTRSLGNLRCISSAACWNGYAAFSSWQDGYAAFYRLISGPYYVGSGLNTIASIIPKYAPSSDGNNPFAYIAAVESDMQSWRAA
jgi:hypothetical protein